MLTKLTSQETALTGPPSPAHTAGETAITAQPALAGRAPAHTAPASPGTGAGASSIPPVHTSPASAGAPVAQLARKLHIQFLAGEGFMQKYEEARSLLSKRGAASFEQVFETLIEEFLERHSPRRRQMRRERRHERAKERSQTKNTSEKITGKKNPQKRNRPEKTQTETRTRPASRSETDTLAGKPPTDKPSRKSAPQHPARAGGSVAKDGVTRHIPAAVRDRVFTRDRGRCAYVGATGERCGSTHHLEIDHVIPFARGGSSSAGNLRLLCERHNRLEAERWFGTDRMNRFTRKEGMK